MISSSLPRVGITGVLVVAAIACSSSSSGEPSGPALTYASAYCRRLDRCRPRLVRDQFGDPDTCAHRLFPDLDDEIRAPGTRITEAQMDACAARMSSVPCDVLTSAIAECNFVGTLDPGAPCGSGYQCTTGSCFRATNGSGASALCGECSARVPVGAECGSANCAAGLSCAAGRCAAPGGEGAACDPDRQPCQAQLQCAGGRCVRELGSGASCTPVREGQPDPIFCDPLLFCTPSPTDPAAGTCTPVRYAALGEGCGLDESKGELAVCAGASCTSLTGGTCVADLAEGATCDPDAGGCEVPLECIDGRCGRRSIATCR